MRRNLGLMSISVAFAIHGASAMEPIRSETPAKKMNVLFIAVDDLNDWIGVLKGNPQVVTPNLDRLGKRGVYFTNAHCASPVCNTSRYALLSGLAPATTGWHSSSPKNGKAFDKVMAGRNSLPTHFKNNGYTTLAVGKIFHTGVQDFDYPFWDVTRKAKYGMPKDDARPRHFLPFPPDHGAIYQAHGGRVKGDTLCWGALEDSEMPKDGMPDEQMAAWAVERLSKVYDKPFLLSVGFARPHVPYTAPKRYFDLYPLDSIEVPHVPQDEFTDIPVYGKAMAYGTLPDGDHAEVQKISPTYWRELVRAYLACTTFVDEQVGKVLDALDASPYAENTVVVLWSDHGQHLGEKRHWRKQALWEESTRVPLLISVPAMASKGQQCDRPVSLLDVFPTLSELCSLPKQKLDGVSLTGLLDDVGARRGAPVVTTWHYGNHSVRSQDWRYTRYLDGTEELYDHRVDSGEHVNLASNPEFASVLKNQRQWLMEHDAANDSIADAPNGSLEKQVREMKSKGAPDWLQ